MINSSMLKLKSLGQVGYLFEFLGTKWVIDPYLFNYVADLYGSEFNRLIDVELNGKDLAGIKLILITHEHEDHCDPTTINHILKFNSNVRIVCPKNCNDILTSAGIASELITNPHLGEEIQLDEIKIEMIPSAHTNLEIEDGFTRWAGYLIKIGKSIIYHAGDTVPYFDMDNYLPKNIDLAFLPINENNFFRVKAGIIGNMTCREALQLIKEFEIQEWIPTHWDLFSQNGTYKEELDFLAKKLKTEKHIWIDANRTHEFQIKS